MSNKYLNQIHNSSFKNLPEEINQTLRKNNIMLQTINKNTNKIQNEKETYFSRGRILSITKESNFGIK